MASTRITWKRPRSPGWLGSGYSDCPGIYRRSPAPAVGACWARCTSPRGDDRDVLTEFRGASGRQLRRAGQRKRLDGLLEDRLFGEIPMATQHQAARIEHGLAGNLACGTQAQAVPQGMQHDIVYGPV